MARKSAADGPSAPRSGQAKAPPRPAGRKSKPPKPPPHIIGRSHRDFEPLLPAEKILRDECARGGLAFIAATRPMAESGDNTVRSTFVRFLLLGGDAEAPVHESGVRLWGAWLQGSLDLSDIATSLPLFLAFCRMESVKLNQSRMASVKINESQIAGKVSGDQMECSVLFLRQGTSIGAGVSLIGAKIQGSLDLSGARIRAQEGAALTCDVAEIGGTVFLDERMYAAGEVRFVGATIGDALSCNGSKFRNPTGDALSLDRAQIGGSLFLNDGFFATGTVRLNAARIGSNLEISGGRVHKRRGRALEFERAQVADSFIFLSPHGVQGEVNLSGMITYNLLDSAPSWEGVRGRLVLDGLKYDRFGWSSSTVDAESRVRWLCLQSAQHLGGDFKPQPWEHLAKVLREMGHADEARRVLVEKQHKMRDAGRYVGGSRVWDRLYGALVGYGYRPWRLLLIAFVVWLACGAAYSLAIRPHWFGATTPLLSPARPEANTDCLIRRVAERSAAPCPRPKPDYSTFVSLAYSAEVLLPVISLGAKAEWRPVLSHEGRPLYWGWALFAVYWFEIAFGWLSGLLLVAAIGNLVKKE